MSEGRVNHNAVTYGPFIVVSGGHNLVKGVPTSVKTAVSFNVLENPVE